MAGAYPNAIKVLQNENFYGNFYFGNGVNAELDINGATMIAPVLERKSSVELATYVGKQIGQLVYNTTTQTVNFWDGIAWREISPSVWSKPYPARITIDDGTTTPTTLGNTYVQNGETFTFNNGDRVLFANNQDVGTTYNGLYTFNGSSWTRHEALNENDEIPGSTIISMEGKYKDKLLICTTDPVGFNVGTSNINYRELSTANNYEFAEGLLLYSGNKVKVDYVSSSGLEFVGTGDNAQLDTKVKPDGAILKSGGLGVNVDNSSVKIIDNKLTAVGTMVYVTHNIVGNGNEMTIDINTTTNIEMLRFSKIADVTLKHINGDSRLELNETFFGQVKIINNNQVIVKFSTINNANYVAYIYGY